MNNKNNNNSNSNNNSNNISNNNNNSINNSNSNNNNNKVIPKELLNQIDNEQEEERMNQHKHVNSEENLERIAGLVKELLVCLGENPEREGLVKTPIRVAKAFAHFTQGYTQDLSKLLNDAVFLEDTDEMVIVRNIRINSLCEHHLVPFTGVCHIGYIPKGKVIGLSKLARIADMFSQRLQVQERLTKQIAASVQKVVEPLGVAVVIEAEHMCMVMRGVEKAGSTTVTSCMLGAFRNDPRTREEFLSLIKGAGK